MDSNVEILAPAGSYESLRAAISAGADAVYLGGSRYGARAYARNLSQEDLLEAIDYVHIHGRKIYLTVNTLLKDWELNELYEYLLPYYQRGLDAVIVQDTGVMRRIRQWFPDLSVHASTHMTITNTLGASCVKEYGITRVVPARELSLDEIRSMKQKTGLEMECFVHGALCYCYSGQCLLSSMIGGRSGNRGQCAQPCRLPYRVQGKKPEDIMSLKDLCTIDFLPELIEAGIDSFKIEGRMKQPDYVYTVVKMYRKYADLYLAKGKDGFRVSQRDKEDLLRVYQRRGYTKGYYHQHNGKDMISFQRPGTEKKEESEWKEVKLQEKINGKLILSVGQNAKLLLNYQGRQVMCEGEPVQEAMRQPLDADRVEKQIRKTGNTEYTFDRLEVQMEGNVFLPMQALNELRREAIRCLTQTVLAEYRREIPEMRQIQDSREEVVISGQECPEIAVLVQNEEQLEQAITSERISSIYVESLSGMDDRMIQKLREGKRPGIRYILAMPYIFRDQAISRFEKIYDEMVTIYDGVMVRNLESLEWLKMHGYPKEIRSDSNVYVWNQSAKQFAKEQGICRYTAPAEFNDRELKTLNIEGAALTVYGYQPVMITAGCIQKSSSGCDGKEGYLSITDRYQKQFSVRKCCRYCYNIIYNSAPLYLADKADEIMALHPAEVRLDFCREDANVVREMIEIYGNAFSGGETVLPPDMEYTRGHFKRGVK